MKQKIFIFLLFLNSLNNSSTIFFVDGTPTISDEFDESLRRSPISVKAACNSIVTFTQANTPQGELWSIVESVFWCYHKTHTYNDLQKIIVEKACDLEFQQQEMLVTIFERQKKAKEERDKRDAQPSCDPFTVLWNWWHK